VGSIAWRSSYEPKRRFDVSRSVSHPYDPDHEPLPPRCDLRRWQEQAVATSHSLAVMEFALAREAVTVGRALERFGLPFDPTTFVASRILDTVADELVEPLPAFGELVNRGAVERSAAMAEQLLSEPGH
jgi:hypothetical protein